MKLKEIDIKSCMLFFDDIIDINHFDLDNISLEEKKMKTF